MPDFSQWPCTIKLIEGVRNGAHPMEDKDGGEHESEQLDHTDTRSTPYDFGPLTYRQAENIADFTIRRGESLQFEKIGRAVAKKVVYLLGALGLALWAHIDNGIAKFFDWMTR